MHGMRTMFVAGLFMASVTSALNAAGPTELSTQTAEVDRDKDVRTEIISRDGLKQMMVMSRRDQTGGWKVTARSFYLGPHLSVTEADEDEDGFLEMLVIHRENPEDVNAFVRERDGSVRPADLRMIDALRKQNEVLTELWSTSVSDPEKMEAAIMEAREKIRAIGEEAKKVD